MFVLFASGKEIISMFFSWIVFPWIKLIEKISNKAKFAIAYLYVLLYFCNVYVSSKKYVIYTYIIAFNNNSHNIKIL